MEILCRMCVCRFLSPPWRLRASASTVVLIKYDTIQGTAKIVCGAIGPRGQARFASSAGASIVVQVSFAQNNTNDSAAYNNSNRKKH